MALRCFSTIELQEKGYGRCDIERMVRLGQLVRVGRGWFAQPHADQRVVRAVVVGGRLGCLSALSAYKLWVPDFTGLHVGYGRGRRPRPRPGVEFHFTDQPCPTQAIWPVADCLAQVTRRHDAETALVAFESALYKGLVTDSDIRTTLNTLPLRAQRIGPFVSTAESGSETRVRYFLQRKNIPVRPQVKIEGVGRVDLLVGTNLIIECDSDEHHRTIEEHQEDRRRDLAARDLGFRVLRLTYAQIWRDWPATRESLLRLIHERRHLPSRSLLNTFG